MREYQATRAELQVLRRAARLASAPAPVYRATHRVDRPGRPPLYTLREADAMAAATPESAIYLHTGTGHAQSWDFWRMG